MRPALSRSLGFVAAPAVFWGPFALEIAHRFVLTIAAPLAVIAVFSALRSRQRPGEEAWPLAIAMLAGTWLATPIAMRFEFVNASLAEIAHMLAGFGLVSALTYHGSLLAFPLASLALLAAAALGPRRGRSAELREVPGEYVLREPGAGTPPLTGSGR